MMLLKINYENHPYCYEIKVNVRVQPLMCRRLDKSRDDLIGAVTKSFYFKGSSDTSSGILLVRKKVQTCTQFYNWSMEFYVRIYIQIFFITHVRSSSKNMKRHLNFFTKLTTKTQKLKREMYRIDVILVLYAPWIPLSLIQMQRSITQWIPHTLLLIIYCCSTLGQYSQRNMNIYQINFLQYC